MGALRGGLWAYKMVPIGWVYGVGMWVGRIRLGRRIAVHGIVLRCRMGS